MLSKENTFSISGIRFIYKFVISDIKTKQNKIFVVFEILANVLLTLINWLLKPKCMLKYCLLVYEKHNMIFFLALRHLAVCTKTFFLFSNFFVFLEVLTKTGYFNTEFCIFNEIKIYNNNNKRRKNTRGNSTNLKKLGWAKIDPKQNWARTGP